MTAGPVAFDFWRAVAPAAPRTDEGTHLDWPRCAVHGATLTERDGALWCSGCAGPPVALYRDPRNDAAGVALDERCEACGRWER